MGDKAATAPRLLAPVFRERLRAALRIPAAEALFPTTWTPAARRMIPNSSPRLAATAIWGPVLGWCALQLLAESVSPDNPEAAALDLFDRLRLREPFAQAFAALGSEGEEAWRAAARIKVVLLTGAGVGKEEAPAEEVAASAAISESVAAAPTKVGQSTKPELAPEADQVELAGDELVALAPALWHDPDVRWLTGAHQDKGIDYLVREQYEELLWWLQVPSLLRLGSDAVANRASARQMSMVVEDALLTAEAASYRIDLLPGTAPSVDDANAASAADSSAQPADETTPIEEQSEISTAQEVLVEAPVQKSKAETAIDSKAPTP